MKAISENKQEAPFSIQIELTEGCNLRCSFCGINGIRGKERTYNFLSVKNAKIIADRIKKTGWNPRIEFAMHGEPTMNPDFLKIIKTFRKRLPKLYFLLESNGVGLMKDNIYKNIKMLFKAGINTVALDEYQNIKFVPKVRKVIKANMAKKKNKLPFEYYEYPKQREGNPHTRRPCTKKVLTLVSPIDTSTKGTHASLNNHCGGGSKTNKNGVGLKCAKPFREISIRWDGNIALCCNDWRGYYKCGNVLETKLDKIWNNKFFHSARRKLYRGERTFNPCLGCDAKSYRVGFLPDKMGKLDMKKPTKGDEKIVKEAVTKKPYTKPIFREWEKAYAKQ